MLRVEAVDVEASSGSSKQTSARWGKLRHAKIATSDENFLPSTRWPSRHRFFATDPEWYREDFWRETKYYCITIMYLVDIRGLFLASLSCILTWLCYRNKWFVKFPSSFLALSCIFPIVMTIKDAQSRRDKALADLASIKATGQMVYMMHNHWGSTYIVTDNNDHRTEEGEAMRETLGKMWRDIRIYLKACAIEIRQQKLLDIYRCFNDIDLLNQQLGGGKAISSAGCPIDHEKIMLPIQMLSRANQYLRIMMTDFEQCRVAKDYRTSRYLRAYGIIFMNISPILLAPYFAQISKDSDNEYAGMLSAIMFSFILISLHHIQLHLEDPFDGDGEDDIFIEGLVREMRGYMEESGSWHTQFVHRGATGTVTQGDIENPLQIPPLRHWED